MDLCSPKSTHRPTLSARALLAVREAPSLSLKVKGNCMMPLIADGQRVQVSKRKYYWPGDIVGISHNSGATALHRCIGYRIHKGRLCILTRADSEAPELIDTPTPLPYVLGKLSSGECTAEALNVPWATRLLAIHHYLRWCLRKIRQRRP